MTSHDWFERITGFREDGYDATQRRLRVEGDELVSLVNGKTLRDRGVVATDPGGAAV